MTGISFLPEQVRVGFSDENGYQVALRPIKSWVFPSIEPTRIADGNSWILSTKSGNRKPYAFPPQLILRNHSSISCLSVRTCDPCRFQSIHYDDALAPQYPRSPSSWKRNLDLLSQPPCPAPMRVLQHSRWFTRCNNRNWSC